MSTGSAICATANDRAGDFRHLVAIAAGNDDFAVFLYGFDERGKAVFGFVHVD